jgi:hypothetical protein
MRELANLSAHAAIDQYSKRTAILATRSKLLVAIVGAVVGGGLLWTWRALMPTNLVVLWAAVTAFSVAGIWGIEYLVRAGWMIFSERGKPKRSQGQRAEPPDAHAAIESEQIDQAADTAPEQPDFQRPSEEAPVDSDTVIRGTGHLGLLRDEPPQEPAEPSFEAMKELPGEDRAGLAPPPSSQPEEAKEAEEEESIDDYMGQLMERVYSSLCR